MRYSLLITILITIMGTAHASPIYSLPGEKNPGICEASDGVCHYNEGLRAIKRQNNTLALRHFSNGCKSFHSQACNARGAIYLVAENWKLAKMAFREACLMGNENGCNNLQLLIDERSEVEVEEEEEEEEVVNQPTIKKAVKSRITRRHRTSQPPIKSPKSPSTTKNKSNIDITKIALFTAFCASLVVIFLYFLFRRNRYEGDSNSWDDIYDITPGNLSPEVPSMHDLQTKKLEDKLDDKLDSVISASREKVSLLQSELLKVRNETIKNTKNIDELEIDFLENQIRDLDSEIDQINNASDFRHLNTDELIKMHNHNKDKSRTEPCLTLIE